MSRLIVVSNRVALPRDRSARAGGLAVGVLSALKRAHGIWFGWSGETSDAPAAQPRIVRSGGITYATMDFTPEEFDAYYNGYCNSTLWPLLHYRLGLVEHSRAYQDAYMRINARFADQVAAFAKPDDVIWVHDYQLMALPGELRLRGLRNRIGFFLHIPLPGPEIFCALPAHRQLMNSLASADLVGFQTESDLRAFRDYALYEVGGQIRPDGAIEMFGRRLRSGVFPIGIDVREFEDLAEEAETDEETRRLADSVAGRQLIIGVDRLDYSKGILSRIDAIGELLSSRPDYRNRITFVQIAAPSRIDVSRYKKLRREIEANAGRVNGKHAEIDWVPIRYLNRVFPRRQLAGFYRVAKLGLVTPLRDGMNLVAKEYVAAQRPEDPGVLVLSRFAGAAREMKGAIIVNPFDTVEVAEAIDHGLRMPLKERQERWQRMMTALRRNDLATWSDSFLDTLTTAERAAA
ncbi:MAG TPA: alpha,alpha-trehalose-phosphate synthase (UDP-forming) [Candidatus Binatia bacterium]|nr:alpha,alpha-trehalose-phosphate synthase (UDP-forming) [Candidatus Binatia bacterium]